MSMLRGNPPLASSGFWEAPSYRSGFVFSIPVGHRTTQVVNFRSTTAWSKHPSLLNAALVSSESLAFSPSSEHDIQKLAPVLLASVVT
jgi:hypothetical protein